MLTFALCVDFQSAQKMYGMNMEKNVDLQEPRILSAKFGWMM